MEFIIYEKPSGRKIGASHAVRSHVTKRQHRLKREAENKSHENQGSHNDDGQSASDQSSLSVPSGQTTPDTQVSSEQPQRQTPTSNAAKGKAILKSTSPRLPPRVPFELMLPCLTAFNTLESYIHTTMVPEHVTALGMDPAPESLKSSQWFSSASTAEPALYTSALLTATAMFQRVSPDLIFYLKSATITSLRKTLSMNKGKYDPALIIAIECLTFYECLHGDPDIAQRVHRPAMRKLIQAHGGRDNLDIPRSWKKVSLMADIVMEMQMGSESESSFLSSERHEDASILEAEWVAALKIYLPDVEEPPLGDRVPS